MKVVLFDLVGTLIRPTAGIGEQYAYWARRCGAAGADPARLEGAFRQAMRAASPMAFPGLAPEEAAKAERRWWRALVRDVISRGGLDKTLAGPRFDLFFDSLFEHFTTADAWAAYPDAGPALERLRARGVAVGLVTNYDMRVHAVLDAVGLSPLLESVTIPALVGAAKPDAAIFRHALALHHVPADRAAYVGDEPGDDYEGAERAGMLPILLDREGRCGAQLRRIRSLDEL